MKIYGYGNYLTNSNEIFKQLLILCFLTFQSTPNIKSFFFKMCKRSCRKYKKMRLNRSNKSNKRLKLIVKDKVRYEEKSSKKFKSVFLKSKQKKFVTIWLTSIIKSLKDSSKLFQRESSSRLFSKLKDSNRLRPKLRG